MYILALILMLKIYQTRHPDINASAHSAYMVMAFVIISGVTGVVSEYLFKQLSVASFASWMASESRSPTHAPACSRDRARSRSVAASHSGPAPQKVHVN